MTSNESKKKYHFFWCVAYATNIEINNDIIQKQQRQQQHIWLSEFIKICKVIQYCFSATYKPDKTEEKSNRKYSIWNEKCDVVVCCFSVCGTHYTVFVGTRKLLNANEILINKSETNANSFSLVHFFTEFSITKFDTKSAGKRNLKISKETKSFSQQKRQRK